MIRIWWKTIRPKTLFAGISPVILGAVLAYDEGFFFPGLFGTTLFCVLMLQIGANLANDYFDFIQGADTVNRLGPTRALPAGLLSERRLLGGMVIVFFAAFFAGVRLSIEGGRVIFFTGIAAAMVAFLYTAAPIRLGYRGWGETAAFVFFGPVALTGTYYLQAGHVSIEALVLSISPGLFSLALLTLNNYRDRNEDKETGKRTLVVRFGPAFGRLLYTISITGAFASPCLLLGLGQTGAIMFVTPLLGLTCIPVIIKLYRKSAGRWLNKILGATGALQALGTAGVSAVLLID